MSNNNFWVLSKKLENTDKVNHPLAERLDKLLIQACLLGEKKCKRRYLDWWSLPLIQAWSRVHILKVHLSKLQCGASTVKEIYKYGIEVTCPEDITTTKTELRLAQTKVCEIIRNAAEKRREYNKIIAQIHALTGEVKAKQAVKVIINAETMKTMWKKIGYADKGRVENNIMSISIPTSWPAMTTEVTA